MACGDLLGGGDLNGPQPLAWVAATDGCLWRLDGLDDSVVAECIHGRHSAVPTHSVGLRAGVPAPPAQTPQTQPCRTWPKSVEGVPKLTKCWATAAVERNPRVARVAPVGPGRLHFGFANTPQQPKLPAGASSLARTATNFGGLRRPGDLRARSDLTDCGHLMACGGLTACADWMACSGRGGGGAAAAGEVAARAVGGGAA